MLRNFIGLVSGVLLHYVLIIGGSRLAWLLTIGNIDHTKIEYKDGVIRWMLWRTFAIDPAVAVIVGAFVVLLVRRSYWWLGGVATLPLFIYGFTRSADRIEIVSSMVYMILAFVAAFVVSRFKRTQTP